MAKGTATAAKAGVKSKGNGKPGLDRAAFNQKLAEQAEAYAEAEVSDFFTPPHGTYICKLVAIATGSYTPKSGKSQGQSHVYANPVFEIVSDAEDNTDLAGQKFNIFCGTSNIGKFKSTYAKLNAEVIEDPQLAVQEGEGHVGNFYQIAVKPSKQEKEYGPNIYIEALLEEEAAEE